MVSLHNFSLIRNNGEIHRNKQYWSSRKMTSPSTFTVGFNGTIVNRALPICRKGQLNITSLSELLISKIVINIINIKMDDCITQMWRETMRFFWKNFIQIYHNLWLYINICKYIICHILLFYIKLQIVIILLFSFLMYV